MPFSFWGLVFCILGLIAAIIIPPDNFSYIASSIVHEGIESADPIKKSIELYYDEQNRFPSSIAELEIGTVHLPDHVKSLAVSSEGSIIITFDTCDLGIGISSTSLHDFFYAPKSNDLTNKTCSIALPPPTISQGRVVWETKGSCP